MLIDILAQEAVPTVPQIPGLNPNLQLLVYILGALLPFLGACFRAWKNGRTLKSVIVGVEGGAEAAEPIILELAAKKARGEHITKEDLQRVGDVFKTSVHKVAVIDGTEEHLAPRVEKITECLDPAELRKRLGAVLVFFVLCTGLGCASVTKDHVQRLRSAIVLERRATVPVGGLEKEVLEHQATVDKVLAEMEAASK